MGLALYFVAPINGLCEGSWGRAFIEVSKEVGLDLSSGHRGPLLPGLDTSGSWVARSVTTGETTDWLKMTLKNLLGGCVAPGLTSHGLKATTLAWLAKSGHSEETRLILGHHSLRGLKTLESYSRDVQAKPLRELETCMESIKKGAFLPDNTRRGYFPRPVPVQQVSEEQRQPVKPEAAEIHSVSDEAPAEEDGGGQDSDSSSETVSSSSDCDELLEAGSHVLGSVLPTAGSWKPGCDVYQNIRTRTLHLRVTGSGRETFVCGRKLTDDFVDYSTRRVFSEAWRCKQCDAGRPLRDIDGVAAALERGLKARRTEP